MVNIGTPLPSNAYVAILKAKQGELLAVSTTSPDMFVPLLEVPESSKVAAVARAWPHAGSAAWVHPLNVTGIDEAMWPDEVESIFGTLREAECVAVPVVTTGEDTAVLEVVRDTVNQDGRGLVIRIDCEEALESGQAALTTDIDHVLEVCAATAAGTDLVIDAGLVDGGPAVQASVVAAVLASLPYAQDWRSVVVAFSAFPEMVGSVVGPDTVGSVPRTDATSFGHLVSMWNARPLVYADYGVGVPTYADTPWAPIPNIRYALAGDWRVHRGTSRRNPSPQYVALARALAAAPYFDGAGFSPGDAYIQDVANGADGPGNAGSYLRAAMSRHFHVVLDSLATRGAP